MTDDENIGDIENDEHVQFVRNAFHDGLHPLMILTAAIRMRGSQPYEIEQEAKDLVNRVMDNFAAGMFEGERIEIYEAARIALLSLADVLRDNLAEGEVN